MDSDAVADAGKQTLLRGLRAWRPRAAAWELGVPAVGPAERPRSGLGAAPGGGAAWTEGTAGAPTSGKAGVHFYMRLYKEPFPNAALRQRQRRVSVPAVTGSSGRVRFHLQTLRFPSPGSLVISNQNLLGRPVILGKLPKMCGQEPMSFQRGNEHQHLFSELRANWLSLLPREHSASSLLV